LADKNFKVKNKLVIAGLTNSSGVLLAEGHTVDSHTNLATQYGGTGTTTSPNAGQILYSSSGSTYTPTTLTSLDVKGATYSADAPANPVVGQVWIESDSSSDSFDPNIIRRKSFTATAGQTTFTADLEFIQGYEQVFFNGMLLVRNNDYTTPTNTSVVLTTAAAVNDIVEIVSITNLNSINAATTTTNTFTGSQTIAGNVVVGGAIPNLSSSTKAITVDTTSSSGYAALEMASGGVLRGYLNATNGAMYIASVGSNPLVTYTNGSERMRIDSGGNVGIGNSSPGTLGKFAVDQSGQSTAGIFRNTNPSWASDVLNVYSPNGTDTSNISLSARSDGSSWITSGYGPMILRTGTSNSSSEKMRIQANGDVLLSNTDSNALRYLDIYNTNSGVNAGTIIRFITNNNANTAVTTADIVKYRNGDWNFNNGDSAGKIQFYQTDSTKMFINNVGNIGMSSSFFTADAKLHIASVSSLGRGFQISLTDGSYTGDGELLVASRASTSAFNYLRARSEGSGDNEFILRGDGIGYSDGGWTTPAADYAEYFEWEDGNPNNEDRRGYSVSLIDKKIKIAEEGEMVIGIVSAKPSFVGDAHNDHWQAKYLLDEFGAEIQEEYNVISWTDIHGVKYGYEENNVPEDVIVPGDAVIVVQTRSKLNPDFDPSQEYIARENRKEWTTVGMVGKLRMRKGQLTDSRWIKMRDISAEMEEWLVR